MAATEFTFDSVKAFMLSNGGRVTNHHLVTHFKAFLNDPTQKAQMRERFKELVNALATIKVDEKGEKILVLKKKYRDESTSSIASSQKSTTDLRPEPSEARSQPLRKPDLRDDVDSAMSPKTKSEENLRGSDSKLSASASSMTDTASLGSAVSTSSLSSGADTETDPNLSVVSVKERAKHLNRMESESEILRQENTTRGRRDHRGSKDDEDDSQSSGAGYVVLEPLEKQWLVTCSSADYHPMHQLLAKHPNLARLRDFTNTALHWAAKHGRPEVVKLVAGKPGVNVNQRTGYTALHLAAMHGHEEIIELLVQTYKADPNIRDYSGKKAKQYLRNSASTKAQQLLVSSRLGSKSTKKDNLDDSFARSASFRKSSRVSSLIQASTVGFKKAMLQSNWETEEPQTDRTTPETSPSNSTEASPVVMRRRKGSFSKDKELMPPPHAPARRGGSKRPSHSVSKESLITDAKRVSSQLPQVSRSESEPNLGGVLQKTDNKGTYI